MLATTRELVLGIVGDVSDAGGWAGPAALLTAPVVPAVALAEVVSEGARQLGRVVSWGRKALAGLLRRAADCLDPVEAPTVERVARVLTLPAPVVIEAAPVALPMPSAAQATTALVEDEQRVPVESPEARALAEHGGIRAAARALGIAESTLRCRLKKQGVALPKRR